MYYIISYVFMGLDPNITDFCVMLFQVGNNCFQSKMTAEIIGKCLKHVNISEFRHASLWVPRHTYVIKSTFNLK